jgi:hypothetical protein
MGDCTFHNSKSGDFTINSEPTAAWRFRLGEPADLPDCVKLMPPGFRMSEAVRSALIPCWTQLIESEAVAFAVMQDMSRPGPPEIEGFGFSVFVTDEFIETFRAAPQPYVANLFYERLLAGEDVVMSQAQLASANATTGINILTMPYGLPTHDFSNPRAMQVLTVGNAAFFFTHAGYRVKTIVCELYSTHAVSYMSSAGFHLINDFQAQSPEAFVDIPPEQYPYLFELRREWVQRSAMHPLSEIFFTERPIIGFSPSERRLLARALLNDSDMAVAESLGLSEFAIKKTWASIFERVRRVAPRLLPQADGRELGIRGIGKRAHVLRYVRGHMQELRP